MSDESIKPPAIFNNILSPWLNYLYNKILLNLDGSCLKQDKVTFTHKQVANIYIVYETNMWSYTQGADIVLGNSLIGAVKLNKNTADFDKYKCFGLALDLMHVEVFRYQMVQDLVKMQ